MDDGSDGSHHATTARGSPRGTLSPCCARVTGIGTSSRTPDDDARPTHRGEAD